MTDARPDPVLTVITGTNEDGTKKRETLEFVQPPCVGLSAAHYQGTPTKLRALQTDFSASVGALHGLVRGIQNSRASHQTIKQWYGRQINLETRLAAAEYRATTLLKGAQVLRRKVAERAPELARDLGLIKDSSTTQPFMSRI